MQRSLFTPAPFLLFALSVLLLLAACTVPQIELSPTLTQTPSASPTLAPSATSTPTTRQTRRPTSTIVPTWTAVPLPDPAHPTAPRLNARIIELLTPIQQRLLLLLDIPKPYTT